MCKINLKSEDWIKFYINWELLLIKELGFEDSLTPNNNDNIKKSLISNRNLLVKNFITPYAESFQTIIWHCLVSHPLLQKVKTKW